jgi:hypothetical protein
MKTFWSENVKGRNKSGDTDVDRDTIKMNFKETDWG